MLFMLKKNNFNGTITASSFTYNTAGGAVGNLLRIFVVFVSLDVSQDCQVTFNGNTVFDGMGNELYFVWNFDSISLE